MASRSSWKLQSFDVKDAFLTVKQRDELYVLLDGAPFRVLRCLPGQQPAAAWWSEQLTENLKETGLLPGAACPSAFGVKGLGVMIHVDDGLMGGEEYGGHIFSVLFFLVFFFGPHVLLFTHDAG